MEHKETCGCGHEHHHHEHHHEEICGCGCDHEHHHEHLHHEETCGCGCDHEHHHEHHHHEHHHHEGHHHEEVFPETSYTKKVYILENLGCANCAAKMESKIRELPGVEYAAIVFATKQLRLAAEDPDALLPQIQEICASIESEVLVHANAPKKANDTEATSASSKKGHSENEKTKFLLIAGALLFAAGEALEYMNLPLPASVLFLLGYLLLGGRIVMTAGRNLIKGHIFDENFLMSVATIGALIIQEFPEAVGVMLFYRIGEYFEHAAVEKSRSQIMDAVDLRPETVNLVVGNDTSVIPAEEAAVGDLVLIRPGDRVPLDGVVVEGESRIDTSPVTGEPVPVRVLPGSPLTSGCVNTSGLLKMKVEKVLEESMVTRILNSVENAAASKPQIDRFITRFARVYTPFVVALALATAILPSLFTGDWNHWIYTALTFLVISCPCALVLSVPLAFFSGIGAGSKKGILFKGGVSLEAMKNVKAVVLDKTGTLTKGNFIVQKILPAGDMDETALLALCAACELTSTHPIGNSIVTAAKEQGISPAKPESVEEIAGCGIKAQTAEGTVLCGNRKLMEQFHVTVTADSKELAGSEVFAALNGRFAGSLVIADTLKEDAKDAVKKLKSLDITPAMLTGDAPDSANAVAAAVGIQEVHSRLLPQDKLSRLQEIRQKYGAVMFVGDGINDAPVLAGADVGAAMGSGADAAIEAADVVFMNSSVEAVVQAVKIARITNTIAWQNVIFALAVKVLVMILGLAGFASMWMAVFADTGVAMLCVLNSVRILYNQKSGS